MVAHQIVYTSIIPHGNSLTIEKVILHNRATDGKAGAGDGELPGVGDAVPFVGLEDQVPRDVAVGYPIILRADLALQVGHSVRRKVNLCHQDVCPRRGKGVETAVVVVLPAAVVHDTDEMVRVARVRRVSGEPGMYALGAVQEIARTGRGVPAGHARFHDRMMAADHYRAMAEIESRFDGGEGATSPPDSGQLLALVDALHAGTLNDTQRETVQALRIGILALAESGDGSRARAV